ncbi:hypothetical protein CHCC14819_0483 [Bacillus licheniformis]|uniref:DUF3846 domain-containing protein n=1 Tax=Bacillus licheniformis TaxID=1402 RepID=UPI0011A501E1|nr:DUF3846 domain-containing protein [Bacillus licheniformis]TWM32287.1 hypothetical protein CHCC14819_0483 [Bacillus licheniformis]
MIEEKLIKAVVVEPGTPFIKVIEEFPATLRDMQEFVEGYVGIVKVDHSITIWVNDDGRKEELTPNFALLDRNDKVVDYVAGKAFFAGTDDEGNTISLTDEEIKDIKSRFVSRDHFKLIK